MNHRLKIHPNHFEAVLRGDKKHEIRDNTDRGFQRGDSVELVETIDERPTGNVQLAQITYVTNVNQPPNQVVFSFSLAGEPYRNDS